MVKRTAEKSITEQLEEIPVNSFFNASRYDDDNYHILHLWDDEGNSYDIVAKKEER